MLAVRRLIWGPGNVAHIARHAVTPEEVEEVCHGAPVVQVGKKGVSASEQKRTEKREQNSGV